MIRFFDPENGTTATRLRTIGLTLLALIVVAEGYFAICVRRNDFLCHRDTGKRFLAGDPTGNDIYPVGRTLMNVPLALAPLNPTRFVVFTLALLSLAWIYRAWRRMASDLGSTSPSLDHRAVILLGIGFGYILLRDLDECGMQVFTLFFLTAAGYCLLNRKTVLSGFWLATAITYKLTPMLALPFLLWKRQFRAAASTVAFLLFWAALPALFLGVDVTLQCHQTFLRTAISSANSPEVYPRQLGREPAKPQNLSLQATLARFLITFPNDHPVYQNSPLFLQFGNFSDANARTLSRGLILLLGLVLAYRFWPRRAEQAPMASTEWAVVCVLCAVMSPICWRQHLVLGLPCGFLLLREVLRRPLETRALRRGLIACLVVMLPIHELFGETGRLISYSYKVESFALLFMTALVLVLPTGKKRETLGQFRPQQSEDREIRAAA